MHSSRDGLSIGEVVAAGKIEYNVGLFNEGLDEGRVIKSANHSLDSRISGEKFGASRGCADEDSCGGGPRWICLEQLIQDFATQIPGLYILLVRYHQYHLLGVEDEEVW